MIWGIGMKMDTLKSSGICSDWYILLSKISSFSFIFAPDTLITSTGISDNRNKSQSVSSDKAYFIDIDEEKKIVDRIVKMVLARVNKEQERKIRELAE